VTTIDDCAMSLGHSFYTAVSIALWSLLHGALHPDAT